MKVTVKHFNILEGVRKHTFHNRRCMKHLVTGHYDQKQFDTLVKNGLLELYQAKTPIKDGHGSFAGSILVRLTSAGITVLAKEAVRLEGLPIEVRVAKRLEGVDTKLLEEIGYSVESDDYDIYVNAARVLENTLK